MEEIFGMLGQALLSGIAAAAIIGIALWMLFGFDGEGGPLGLYIVEVMNSILG